MASSAPMARAIAPNPLLSTFQRHIEDMRSLVLCKICIKPLYEPYILACGHTYCYSCLGGWFGGTNKRKRKNCPDCRSEVFHRPSPNYLLRDLVHMFISRTELLPEDETTQEHDEAKGLEAQQIELDKGPDGQGMFNGAFTGHHHYHPQHGAAPIRDHEDGVDRCPNCAWELEDGMCNQCGFNEEDDGFSDTDSEGLESASVATPSVISVPSSDLDGDVDALDHDLADGTEQINFHANGRPFLLPPFRQPGHFAPRPNPPQLFIPPWDDDEAYSLHSSEGDDTAIPDDHSDVRSHDSEDDVSGTDSFIDDDEGDDEAATSDSDEEITNRHPTVHQSAASFQPSPATYVRGFHDRSATSSSPHPSDYTINSVTSDDEPLPARRVGNPTSSIPLRRARPRFESDSDENDADADNLESEPTMPTPPQAAADRQAHLASMRARRGRRGTFRGRGRGRPRRT